MALTLLVWICLLSSLGHVTLQVQECTKSTDIPYDIVLNAEQNKISSEEEKRYNQSLSYTFCVRFLYFENSNGNSVEVIVPVTDTDLLFADNFPLYYIDEAFKDNTWYHTCIVSIESQISLYVDGYDKIDAGTFDEHEPVKWVNSLTLMLVENINDSPDAASPRVSDVRYYDTALTETEVEAVFCGDSSAPKDLINWNELSWCETEPQKSTAPTGCSKP